MMSGKRPRAEDSGGLDPAEADALSFLGAERAELLSIDPAFLSATGAILPDDDALILEQDEPFTRTSPPRTAAHGAAAADADLQQVPQSWPPGLARAGGLEGNSLAHGVVPDTDDEHMRAHDNGEEDSDDDDDDMHDTDVWVRRMKAANASPDDILEQMGVRVRVRSAGSNCGLAERFSPRLAAPPTAARRGPG